MMPRSTNKSSIKLIIQPVLFQSIGVPLLVLVFTGFSIIGFTQPIEDLFFKKIMSENVRIEKGLSQNSVYSIFQDKDDFLWIGTWDGLNKFDAYSFTIFSKKHGLTNETIRTLFQDGDLLWVGTENGLNTINLNTGEFRNYYSDPSDSTSLTNSLINHIFVDHLNRLWICTASGLSQYHYETDDFTQIFSRDYGDPMRSNNFNMMGQDFENNFWIATNYGLVHYEPATNIVTRYFRKPDDPLSLPSNQINAVITDENGRVWIGTSRGLAYYLPETRQFITVDLLQDKNRTNHQPEITTLAWESKSGLWAGTNGEGLFYIDSTAKTINCFTHSPNRPYTISDNRVQHIYIDKQGIIWVGTYNGLNKIDRNAPRFKLYRNEPGQENSIRNNSVWCFLEISPDQIWIGTDGGITIFNPIEFTFDFIVNTPGQSNSLSDNQIRCIYKDSAGLIWIGTRNRGVNVYDPSTGSFTHFVHRNKDVTTISDNFIYKITGTADGTIWIGTQSGLNRFDRTTNSFFSYEHDPTDDHSLPDNRIYSLFVDPDDRLWISTANGFSRYRPENDDFVTYKIPEAKLESNRVYTNQFFSASLDDDGNFWLGTRGGGLVKFDANQNRFDVFTQAEGLPNNVVYGALFDNNNKLWAPTNWGVSRFDPIENSFINYEVTDGLQSNEFNLNASMQASNGEIYIGGMNGFNVFLPESIKTNKQPPPVRITDFRIFNLSQPVNLRFGDTLQLTHNDNFFSFEFTALDFRNPDKNKYQFKLEGYDVDWVERSADKRFAEYANIKPGNYSFKVIAANSDGFWNSIGTSLFIIVKPPWHATYLFRTFLTILILSIIFLIFRLRTKSINRKHEIEKKYLAFEKQLFELEQKALQLQMNPHFLFNSLNSIQSFVLNNDIDNAILYLSKFSQLMRRTLTNSRESMIPFRDEIQALTLYLEIEKLRFENKFEYQIHVDPDIDDSFIEIPPMILQPYVENAIIHGLMHSQEKGHLKINITLNEDTILCVIEDDGIGREKAAEIRRESGIERKSRGMLITKERLEILNQYSNDQYTVNVIDLKDNSGNPAGTRVEVSIVYNEI
jgi:ligand-binding sensor domain-containing protein